MEKEVIKYWDEKTCHIDGLNEHLKLMQEIGMCGSPQPEYLFYLSNSLTGKGAIVEIGTCSGISLIALSLGQKLNKGLPVTSIDIRKHEDIDKNLCAACVEDYTNCIVNDANVVAAEWKDPIELLWIDGDHSYRRASMDIISWGKFIIEGGFIALHDYRDGTGVFKAINRHILLCPWIWRVVSDRECGSIFVAQKLGFDCKKWEDPLSPLHKAKERMKRYISRMISLRG